MSKPTQLIKSSIPNAFTIKNANGTDVVMSLQNTSNQLDIRLLDNKFIFKAENENTRLLYSNIDFEVDDIRTNTISNKDHSNIIFIGNVDFTGDIKHNNCNILVLNSDNQIPTSYISDANYLTIYNEQSNVYIRNSLVNINTCNITNDSTITIKNNATNISQKTVKLVDNNNIGTIQIYSQDPYVGIGYNIPVKTNNIQLYVESNIKCNDIIVDDKSFLTFYSNFRYYESNNDITGIKITDDTLYYSNAKIILENDIEHLRTKDDLNFIGSNFVDITDIYCTTNNTYIIADNILYRLIPDNRYKYIDANVENIKSENGVIIYSKINIVYFLYDDEDYPVEEPNYKTGGYYKDNDYHYHYLVNNTQIIKKRKNDNNNIIIIKTITDIIDIIYIIDEDNYYYIDKNHNLYSNNDLIDNNINTFYLGYNGYPYYIDKNHNLYSNNDLIDNNINTFYLGYNGYPYYSSNLIVNSLTSNIYELIDKNLYKDGSLNESNVLKVHHSDRHLVILKDDFKIYTKSFDDSYNGLGKTDNLFLDDNVGLGIICTDTIQIKPSVNIGSSLDTLKNTTPNSLCVENCISIACKPSNDFALRLKGDILIEGGGNIYRTEDKSSTLETSTTPLILDDYVLTTKLDAKVDDIESNISVVLASNLATNTSNINTLLQQYGNIWRRESNIVLVNDTRVIINKSTDDDYNVLGGSKLPALFVGNYSSNIKGIICEDDIAAYSDQSLKTDVSPIKDSLNKVLKLNGVNYRRKDNLDKICMGLIAQNVEKYCPEVVQEHNNIKTVAYANLVALLIEAVKELYDIIKDGKE